MIDSYSYIAIATCMYATSFNASISYIHNIIFAAIIMLTMHEKEGGSTKLCLLSN